ncbi:hypothetical protein [Chryseobacterium sp. SG20098]|uniref:hypothetical protein n=1 Tax=Chryseobacterium sp. SG20098 TaxID=3074145 RepID=UPI002883039B|nr:hypothetical protein [Chryseobacterium sp. SG20098]WNI39063.1 hypothetical protein RHP76_11305 [Chryseobacterium sp. SG20098]
MNNFNTGYYLKKIYFEKALKLISAQIDDDSNSGKTLELLIYRKNKSIKNFNLDHYYENYIEKDIFYNKQNFFFNLEYLIPKGIIGVRTFNYLSFENLILYYALGFYCFDLVSTCFKTIEDKKKKRNNIFTFYGCEIDFDNPLKSNLNYFTDYVEFNNSVNDKIEKIISENKKAVIIKLDIQDYFKTIDFDILLKILSKYSTNTKTKKLKFDENTKDEIKNIFTFINKDKIGVPLFSQNLISNFLSYIYLYELDNFIQNSEFLNTKDFLYSRYVDDFYIIYKENKGKSNQYIGTDIFNLSSQITQFLSSKLNLKINNLKTQNLIICNDSDLEDFIKKEKVISIPESLKEDVSPQEKLEEVLKIIEDLKKKYKKKGSTYLTIEDNNKLNEIFKKNFKQFLKSNLAIAKLEKAFKDWIHLINLVNPQALYFLMSNTSKNKEIFNFLITNINKYDTPQYYYLLEKFILHNNLSSNEKRKFNSISSKNSYYKLIKASITNNNTFDINIVDFPIPDKILKTHDILVQQIKLLNLAEIDGKYNVAFNHLLNIYHFYCSISDKNFNGELKYYNQHNITDFLDSLNFSIEYINFSLKFFDMRNKNNISHPGEKLMENWTVSRKEYIEYRNNLIHLIEKINNSLKITTINN